MHDFDSFSKFQNFNIFIQESAFESIVCEMTAILSRPQCVKFMFINAIRPIPFSYSTSGYMYFRLKIHYFRRLISRCHSILFCFWTANKL